MTAEEKPRPQEPLLERQGVVTDAIIAGAAGGAAGGVAKVVAEKIADALVNAPPPEPQTEVILPPGVEKPD